MVMAEAFSVVWLPMANPNLEIFVGFVGRSASCCFSCSLLSTATGNSPSITPEALAYLGFSGFSSPTFPSTLFPATLKKWFQSNLSLIMMFPSSREDLDLLLLDNSGPSKPGPKSCQKHTSQLFSFLFWNRQITAGTKLPPKLYSLEGLSGFLYSLSSGSNNFLLLYVLLIFSGVWDFCGKLVWITWSIFFF